MLLKRFQHEFDAYSRNEGNSYFRRGAVKRLRSGNGVYHLTVKGSVKRPYDVRFNFREVESRDSVVASCSCPRFADGVFCKHLWAALNDIEDSDDIPLGKSRLHLEWSDPEDVADFDELMTSQTFIQGGEIAALEQQLAKVKAELISSGVVSERAISPPQLNPQAPHAPAWAADLQGMHAARFVSHELFKKSDTQLWFAVNVNRSLEEDRIAIDLFVRQVLPEGGLSKPRFALSRAEIEASIGSRAEHDLLQYCWEQEEEQIFSWMRYQSRRVPAYRLSMDVEAAEFLFPRLAQTGRLVWLLRSDQPWDQVVPLRWETNLHRFELIADRSLEVGGWKVSGQLAAVDGLQVQPVGDVVMSIRRLVLLHDRIGMLANETDHAWISKLAPRPWIVTDEQRLDFLQYLSESIPTVTRFPSEFCQAATIEPVAVLAVDLSNVGKKQEVVAKLVCLYGDARTTVSSLCEMAFDKTHGVLYTRDHAREQAFVRQAKALLNLPQLANWMGQAAFRLPMEDFPKITRTLTEAGWIVEANNERLRTGGKLSLSVASSKSSNIDWFDLSGKIEFEGGWATTLPNLLNALRHGQQTIRLDDGSVGLLPEEWIKRLGRLAEFGDAKEGQLRFQSSQALLLDALLASDSSAQVDLGFQKIRERLKKTHQVKLLPSPKYFMGELRDYQKHGQGWLSCLHELKLGGCLADDMGLGKTIQVLSWLETLRQKQSRSKSAPKRPSLVVVPKSLVFNWVAEAAKFTPKLRVLNFTGKERVGLEDLKDIDLVVTTYGTMRLDIEKLREIDFEYLILDEAQAIKNSNAQAAKAARLLKGQHRLAMSGTPIENHIGELWSLFEFINPGLLGNSTAFQRVARSSAGDPESLQWLSKAIAPFVLRRTKAQVLTELPEKSEQVIYCDMTPKHRKLYDELRDHYRASLTKTVGEKGLENSKIHVLEALLRLRQAACHPGLLNPKLAKDPGPKLEELLERLREITEEGHKALVFSQFTSFLAILQTHLQKEKLPYLYLDGKTTIKDRQSRVEKFQSDPNSSLFLISLKAGGSGLNLTSADYVFLLDPWWNPAVENQAIDRTHRIGQTRKVHACRLITRETVEEKVLELQKTKKHLAEAILSIDGSLLRSLNWEDLQRLFT